MRRWIFALVSLGTLVAMNAMIVQKEALLRSGYRVVLRLAPRDPRSLLQGDYMELNYEIANQLRQTLPKSDGHLVVKRGENDVAAFVRVHDGAPLGSGEHLLRYRNRDRLRLGAESWLFQEGQGQVFQAAKYGELRVDASGDCVLVGLLDEKLHSLGR